MARQVQNGAGKESIYSAACSLLIVILLVIIASFFVPGLHISTPLAALVAGAFLGLVNALVRPILLLLTLPLTLLTLGLFIFVINSACLALAAFLVPGFSIDGFGSAFFGALIVSVVSWILSGLLTSGSDPH